MLVAVIVAALFGIWGLLGHGGSQLQQQPGTLVIDKQTGTAYVFCQGGKLCPVLNYASARLALHSPSVDQRTVSQASLTKFGRGPLIGIPGLPQPLPDPGLLLRQPWSVCMQTVIGLSGDRTSTTLVGGIGTGGRSLAGRALLAQALGQDWVIWGGQRMPIGRAAGLVRPPAAGRGAAGLARRPAPGAALRTADDPEPGRPGDRPGRHRAGRAGLRGDCRRGKPAAVLRDAPGRPGADLRDAGGAAGL